MQPAHSHPPTRLSTCPSVHILCPQASILRSLIDEERRAGSGRHLHLVWEHSEEALADWFPDLIEARLLCSVVLCCARALVVGHEALRGHFYSFFVSADAEEQQAVGGDAPRHRAVPPPRARALLLPRCGKGAQRGAATSSPRFPQASADALSRFWRGLCALATRPVTLRMSCFSAYPRISRPCLGSARNDAPRAPGSPQAPAPVCT